MGSFQEMFDKMRADYEARNPGQSDPVPPTAVQLAAIKPELPPVDPHGRTAHVRYAFNPHQAARSNGAYHLVLDQPLTDGRFSRAPGDALCKPRAKFWGLDEGGQRDHATCRPCLERAERYGVSVRTPRA